jgi:hypothetical protein
VKGSARRGQLPYSFAAIPRDILLLPEYHQLRSSAIKLMLDLLLQYTGKNNGRLCSSFQVMQRSGWTSKETLSHAKAALLETSFTVLTRKGHAPRTAEWLGFTWFPINYHPSMDIEARAFPYLNFLPAPGKDPNSGRTMKLTMQSVPRNSDRLRSEMRSGPPNIGAMA